MAKTFNVYRDGKKIKSGLTSPTFTDTGLTAGKEYSYQVSEQNEVKESMLSAPVIGKITTITLTINGTDKTGAYGVKTLDEDAYDDLTVKDANTIYKVYEEGGNPAEAAWFLGDKVIDKAVEGGNVVYGRNLIRNGRLNSTSGWTPNTNAQVVVTDDYVELRKSASTASRAIMVATHKLNIKSKASYVVSAMLYSDTANLGNDTTTFARIKETESSPFTDIVFNVIKTIETNKWVSVVKTGVSPEASDSNTFSYGFGIAADIIASVKIKKFKFEMGESATPWTPAPEDVALVTDDNGGGAA